MLSPLEVAQADVVFAEGALAVARERRAEAIRAAMASGASGREVARVIGLSHEAVRKIAASSLTT